MKIFITGGAGFIGCNCAKYFLDKGHEVVVFDNLSRIGAHLNLDWLKSLGKFQFIKGDVRDADLLEKYFTDNRNVDVVFHFAAQTAVTTSITNPREDFEINALGTLNLLETIRHSNSDPIIIYSSTNKVYGNLDYLNIRPIGMRYELVDYPQGISEDFQLDFHSPYGCSKGVADQYVRDYHRIYGMKTVVFRQSCIYGPRQFGVEDQGWVAWFIISALKGNPITIYGDGRQVRDVLHINDLLHAYSKAIDNIELIKSNIYNIGGGPDNQLSLLQLIEMINRQAGIGMGYKFDSWRAGDQKIFCSDNTKLEKELGWQINEDYRKGIVTLFNWIQDNTALFQNITQNSEPSRGEQRRIA
ncbi:MAG: CDP-paratose 2-epimerase [Desulfobacteraceae bacterium 4572_187]|uniref:CDP-paratose 2-epimerase n=1 Tax=Desulfobacteraceae bacterium 4572_187 TaxID=1971620 RepID=A0A1W9U078_9BACT|nr:MAG: CDP-paratose 2-epimerase [Desulfobacteraceae bacterium 4572_187]